MPASILDGATNRRPVAGHDGKSGATLERAVLADGRPVVVKRLDPDADLTMALTHDTTGRELELWRSGVLDRLPTGVRHALVDAWAEERGAVLVMHDLGDRIIGRHDRLDRRRWLFVVERLAAMHAAYVDEPPTGLSRLDDLVGLFAPERMAPYADRDRLPALVLRGWERFVEEVPADVAGPVLVLLADPAPLAASLRARLTTLVHGDLATVNMALDGDDLVLIDWALASVAPGALDLAWFVAGCASVVDGSREQLIADYAAAAGELHDEDALRTSLLAALVWLGWNKALDATEHPSPVKRAAERADLEWWVVRAREALDAGL